MAPLLTTRRSLWLPGVAVLGGAFGIAAVLGLALGARAWWLYLGLVLAILLGFGSLEGLWARRRVPSPPRTRGKLKVIRGGKNGLDLEKDDTTDKQRWLM